jgi:tRNA G18 (ribose-2'-O)-methylase SpoU
MFTPFILKFDRYRSRTKCQIEILGDKTPDESSDESSDFNQKENTLCPNSSLKVFLMSSKLMSNLVQMETSRGSLACGKVPVDRDLNWLFENVLTPTRRKWRILAIDTSYSTSNIGSMIRCSSAFGVHSILISSSCADPWYRQSVRVRSF